MVDNALETQQSRYFNVREELEEFLKKRYDQSHPGYDFQIEVSALQSVAAVCG